MNKLAIRCHNLSKTFGDVRAVDGVSFTLAEGRFLALLGPSGCGKTTTLRLLAGFEPPDSGEIDINGRQVNGLGLHLPPEQRQIGMVFQEYALFPHLNVVDNIAYGIPKGVDRQTHFAPPGQTKNNIAYGIPKGVDRLKRVRQVLELVGLAGVEKRMPYELSGGQQQRVALARALAPQPALILLDEPFSNLDAGLRSQVRAEVRQILREAQATVIFVTHDQEEALSLADEVAVMMAGRLVQVAPPHQLYRRPVNRQVAEFVGDANFLPGEATNGTVTCELGQFPSGGLHSGAVEVMLRPEAVQLVADEAGAAEVIDCTYFGHDQVVQLRLDSGARLRSRLLGAAGDFLPGQRVRLAVQDRAVVYPLNN